MEIFGIAGVTNDALAVARFFVEAVGHGIQAVIRSVKSRMHQLSCLGLEDLLVAELAILQMSDHEIAHIPTGGRNAACGIGFDKLKGLGFSGRSLVAIGHHRLQIVGKRLNECSSLHVERRIDVVLDILIEGLPGNALNDVAGERGGVVRIGWNNTGRKDAIGHVVLEKLFEGMQMLRVGDEKVTAQFFEPGRVSHDVFRVIGFPNAGGILKSRYSFTSLSRSSLPCS